MSWTGRWKQQSEALGGDFVHDFGSVTAEEDDGGGEVGFEAEFLAKGDGVGVVRNVKIGAEDHAGGREDVGCVVPDGAGLVDGALGAGNDVLVFDGLDPEPGREVGEIGDEGDEGAAGADGIPAFINFAIEVGDDGDEHVGWIFAPGVFEQADQRAMESANRGLQDSKEGGRTEGPAVLEDGVVLLLDADASEAAEDVELVGKLLELDEFDLPGALLLGEDGLEGDRGIAMATTGVMKKDMNFFHAAIVTPVFQF